MAEELRKIIHIDMDCFYAAVEMRDNPSFKGIPLAVGGSVEKRGVIATCNYMARKYGIHSAMPSAQALKICPSLTIVPGRMKQYIEESRKIRDIFFQYTSLVEPLSLDEAYLDVTGLRHCGGSATLMAEEIRAKIVKTTGLTASAGVAPNKFLAKIASDWKKPNGIFVISGDAISSFMPSLPVKKIPGVGKVTEKKLNALGLFHCRDLQDKDLGFLERSFGKFGKVLKERSFGRDHREVIKDYPRKSLSLEKTFSRDLTREECLDLFPEFIEDLRKRLFDWKTRKKPEKIYLSKVYVKLKFNDFKRTTVEKTYPFPFYERLWEKGDLDPFLIKHLFELLRMALKKSGRSIRLMGLGVRFGEKGDHQTLRNEQLILL